MDRSVVCTFAHSVSKAFHFCRGLFLGPQRRGRSGRLLGPDCGGNQTMGQSDGTNLCNQQKRAKRVKQLDRLDKTHRGNTSYTPNKPKMGHNALETRWMT